MPDAAANVTITNKMGLHARPATLIVDLASRFTSDIKLYKDKHGVNAKSVLELMMLSAFPGTVLRIEAEGPDADDAVKALTDLVNRKFDEE